MDRTGSAYLFNTTTGEQLYEFTPSQIAGGSKFGAQVAFIGDIAIIGSPDPLRGTGAAYLFDVSTGKELFKLTASDVSSNFGWSGVDISGNIAIVTSQSKADAGLAYFFDVGTGQELLRLTGLGLEAFTDAALDGNSAIVGASLFRLPAPATSGSAYVFDVTRVAGDLDANGLITAADIDLLSSAIRVGSSSAQFDLNGSGQVDLADHQFMIEELKQTWLGDVDLDGVFNSNDLVFALGGGEYEDEIPLDSGWASGDWDADGDFTSGDLVVALADGGYEQGPRVSVAAVPEPSGIVLLVMSFCGFLWRGRSAR